MGRPVVVAHSSGPQGPGEGTEPLVSRLRKELGDGYDVSYPVLPDPDDPHYEPWAKRLDELLSDADESTIVLGHSLGGSVTLKLLSESDEPIPVAGLVLLATPLWGEGGWAARVGAAGGLAGAGDTPAADLLPPQPRRRGGPVRSPRALPRSLPRRGDPRARRLRSSLRPR